MHQSNNHGVTFCLPNQLKFGTEPRRLLRQNSTGGVAFKREHPERVGHKCPRQVTRFHPPNLAASKSTTKSSVILCMTRQPVHLFTLALSPPIELPFLFSELLQNKNHKAPIRLPCGSHEAPMRPAFHMPKGIGETTHTHHSLFGWVICFLGPLPKMVGFYSLELPSNPKKDTNSEKDEPPVQRILPHVPCPQGCASRGSRTGGSVFGPRASSGVSGQLATWSPFAA